MTAEHPPISHNVNALKPNKEGNQQHFTDPNNLAIEETDHVTQYE